MQFYTLEFNGRGKLRPGRLKAVGTYHKRLSPQNANVKPKLQRNYRLHATTGLYQLPYDNGQARSRASPHTVAANATL